MLVEGKPILLPPGHKVRPRREAMCRRIAAFLNGRALEIYGANGLLAPTWAQVNWIAHGEPTAIKDQVRSELGLRRPPGTWPWAITTMARELLARADNSNPAIRLLQREYLIPMEFALLRTDSGCFLP